MVFLVNGIFLLMFSVCVLCNKEIWEQDISDTFKIEGSDLGIQKVNLKCGSDSMHVMLETEKPFSGVMYTRGSFYQQSAPCFVKPANNNERSLQMTFQLDECQTAKNGETFSNVVVIQNDPEVITPGDSAFSLECDFRQPRNLDVEASMQTRDRHVRASKITLVSPDPSVGTRPTDVHVSSAGDSVEYVPKGVRIERPSTDHSHYGTVEEIDIRAGKEEL